MARFLHHDLPGWWCKGSTAFLALSWIFGLISGCSLFLTADIFSTTLMRMAIDGHVSIVGLLCVILVPFLFSAFAVYISQPWLLLPVAFNKAMSFAFVSLGTLAAYGSAGWLMHLLLMFSDLCSLPVLFVYWLRHISGYRRFAFADVAGILLVMLLIGGFDYCFISPIVAKL